MNCLALLLAVCLPLTTMASPAFFSSPDPSDDTFISIIDGLEPILDHAEARASLEGKAVLVQGRKMVTQGTLVLGSCWDYINVIYNRAGFPQKLRLNPFKSKKSGPYEEMSQFQPGDWFYFVNHSYGNVEHSAIFVDWMNENTKEALMLSYAGGKQSVPARYKVYDLSSVYFVIRPKPEPISPVVR